MCFPCAVAAGHVSPTTIAIAIAITIMIMTLWCGVVWCGRRACYWTRSLHCAPRAKACASAPQQPRPTSKPRRHAQSRPRSGPRGWRRSCGGCARRLRGMRPRRRRCCMVMRACDITDRSPQASPHSARCASKLTHSQSHTHIHTGAVALSCSASRSALCGCGLP